MLKKNILILSLLNCQNFSEMKQRELTKIPSDMIPETIIELYVKIAMRLILNRQADKN